MTGLLEPEYKEVILGKAKVRQVFKVPKAGNVAGSIVTEGKITRNSKVRVIRDGIVIHEGSIESLRRFKDDVKEVVEGYEFGIGIEKFNDIKEDDVIEAYVMEEVQRQL
jgi:translation initiation factor IF-2